MFQVTSGETTESFNTQASSFIKSLDVEQRQIILKDAKIPSVDIPEDTMVAMKVDMGIPWEKLKTMSRYLLNEKKEEKKRKRNNCVKVK